MSKWVAGTDRHYITNGSHNITRCRWVTGMAYEVYRLPIRDRISGRTVFGKLAIFLGSFVHDGTPDARKVAYDKAIALAEADLQKNVVA